MSEDINTDLLAALKAIVALAEDRGRMNLLECAGMARNAIARAEGRAVGEPDAEPAERFCEVDGKRYRLLRGGSCGAWGGRPACAALKFGGLLLCAKLGYCGADSNCDGGNWQEVVEHGQA